MKTLRLSLALAASLALGVTSASFAQGARQAVQDAKKNQANPNAVPAELQWPNVPPAGSKERQEAVAKRIAILKDANAELHDKFGVLRELSVLGDKGIVPDVAPFLLDEKLSHMARYALEPIPDPSVDDALRDALGKAKGRPLVGIAITIGNRRDAKAVEPLAALLKGPDEEVAGAAAYAIGKIGSEPGAKVLTDALASVPEKVKASVYDGLLLNADRLASGSGSAKETATAAYDRLLQNDVPGRVKMAALRGAILVRGPAGADKLVEAVKSDDNGAFAIALRLAHELKGEAFTAALAAQLDKILAPKAALLATALGNRGDKAALPALTGLAKNNSADTAARVAAVRAVSQLADAGSVPMLIGLAQGEQADVAKAAQNALAVVATPEADTALVSALSTGDARVKKIAIDVLAQRRSPSAAPALLKVTTDADDAVRLAAISAYGEVASPADLPAMVQLLTAAKGDKELAAAEKGLNALAARTGDKDAAAGQLAAAMASAKPEGKASLLRALRTTGGPKAIAAVRAAIKDADKATADAAVRTLADWTTTDAMGDLLDLAKTAPDATHKRLALRGYVRLSASKEFPPDQRLAMAQDAMKLAENVAEKKAALGAMGQVQNGPALKAVLPYLDDPAVAEEAAAAVVQICDKIVKGPNPQAAKALEKVIATAKNPNTLRQARSTLNTATAKPAK